MPFPARRLPVAITLAAVLCTAAACSQAPGPKTGTGTTGTGAALAPTDGDTQAAPSATPKAPFDEANPRTWTLPLEAYLPGDDEQAQLSRASKRLTQDCMHKAGFTEWKPAPDLPKVGPKTLTDWRYGIHDRTLSAKFGYHPDAAEQQAYDNAMEAGALDGGTTGDAATLDSCGRKSLSAIGGTVGKTYGGLAQRLAGEAYTRSKQEPEVTAVFRKWSSCMKESGYTYREPMDAGDNPKFSGRDVTQQEISTALADLTCRERTKVATVWYQAEARLQKTAQEQNAQALAAERAELDAALKNAATALAGSRDR